MTANQPDYSAAELAQRFGLELRGTGTARIAGVATLSAAGADRLAFLANPHYRSQLGTTRAAAVVLRADDAIVCKATALIAADPYLAFARIAALFEARPSAKPGIHASAIVSSAADVHSSASVGPLCVIEDGAVVAAGAEIGPACVIGRQCRVGAQSRLVARVTLVERVVLGQRVLIHPGAVLGADGFGLAFDSDHWVKVPQLGGVSIGDDCEIGANTTIDRGALDDTVLEEDVRLDNQIQIAHNVHIGAHSAMAGCSAVAGSARIGRYCLIGGGAGILGHITLADRVTISAMSLVTHSIAEAGEYASGTSIQDKKEWRKNAVRFKHLDEMARRLKNLEKEQET